MLNYVILLILSFNTFSYSGPKYFCKSELGKIPVRAGGRVKPLYVHAKETLKFITSQKKIDNLDYVTAFCLLSLKSHKEDIKLNIKTLVKHVDLKAFLELDEETDKIDIEDIGNNLINIRQKYISIKINNSFKKALSKIITKFQYYDAIVKGKSWTIANVSKDNKVDWFPISELFAKNNMINDNQFFVMAKKYESIDKNINLEYKFSKINIPAIALFVSLIAILLTFFKNPIYSLVFASIAIFLELILIIVRIIISGRAPITNMYETVMFSGVCALIISLILGHLRKEKIFIFVGLFYNMLTLMMMNFATGMLSSKISPLVPVLRDNFWLSTHVTSIILSYAALALSWILANTFMVKNILGIKNDKESKFSKLIYNTLQVGTVLLGLGIILGGVWADYSWGRFWGWDPKETGSLIAFLIYMAIIHGKQTNWIPPKRFIPLIGLAFLSVMFAWFGVNYVLAAGLHSYGFSEGGALFLAVFFILQISIVVVHWIKDKTKN